MTHLPTPSLRAVGLATGGFVAAAVLMFGFAMPAVVAACDGARPLDGRFSWDRAAAADLVAACGAAGLSAYRQLAVLDLVYPLLLGVALATWTVLLARRLDLRRAVVRLLLVPVALDVVGDYLENLAVWQLLATASAPTDPLATLGALATVTKNLTGTLAVIVVALLATLVGVRALRAGRRPAPRGDLRAAQERAVEPDAVTVG